MTEPTPAPTPVTAPAAVEPTLKSAESTAVAAVKADVSSVWTKVKPYVIYTGIAVAGLVVGHLIK